MSLTLLTERHANQIAGVLSCYDRVIVQGTCPVFCYADGMTRYLTARGMRIFDFTRFAQPLTDAIKANAEALAAANDLKIDYVRKKNFRKEDKVSGFGAVHYLPAMARQEQWPELSAVRRRFVCSFCQFRQEPNYVGTDDRGSESAEPSRARKRAILSAIPRRSRSCPSLRSLEDQHADRGLSIQ